MKAKKFLWVLVACILGFTLAAFAACGEGEGETDVPATGVTLSETTLALEVGETSTLTAVVTPEDSTDTVVWSTSAAAIATVSNGTVTAVAEGTATITATAGDATATCTVTVTAAEEPGPVDVPATGVTLSETTLALEVGETSTLTATVTPADSTDTVVWSTSADKIATVSNGTVTAVAEGTATITATAGDVDATCTVTVTAAEEPDPGPGETVTDTILIAGTAYDVTYADPGEAVTNADTSDVWWEPAGAASGSKNVSGDFAVVYKWTNTRDTKYSDVVVEVTDGTNYFDANIGGAAAADVWGTLATAVEKSCTLNGVAQTTWPGHGSDTFGGAYTMIVARVGSELCIEVEIVSPDGDVYVYTYAQSNFPTAAVTTQLVGNTYFIDDITVAVGAIEKSAEQPETVYVESVTISDETLELEVGETFQLSAAIEPANATDKTLVWSVDADFQDIVTVDENGLVTAVGAGEAVVFVGSYGTEDGKVLADFCSVTVTEPAPVEMTKDTIVIGGAAYEITYPAKGDAVTNNDKDGAWAATGQVNPVSGVQQVSGDFAVVYTWNKTRDENYPDVWVELFNAANAYADFAICNVLNGSYDLWGDLTVGKAVSFSYTLNGEAAAQPVPGTGGAYIGAFETVVARVGSTLCVRVTLTNGANVHVWTYTVGGFTTEALTLQLSGNTFWIDNITVAVGAIAEAVVPAEQIEIFGAATVPVGETMRVRAVITPAYATERDVVWSVDDESILTIDQDGVITALSVGRAYITAAIGDLRVTRFIDVYEPQPEAALVVEGLEGPVQLEDGAVTFTVTTEARYADGINVIGNFTYAGDNTATVEKLEYQVGDSWLEITSNTFGGSGFPLTDGAETTFLITFATAGTFAYTITLVDAEDNSVTYATYNGELTVAENMEVNVSTVEELYAAVENTENAGKTINLAAGTYTLTKTVEIKQNLTLNGAAEESVILTAGENTFADAGNGGLASIITVHSGATVIIQNLTVTGAKKGSVSANGHGLNITGGSTVTVKNVSSTKNAAAGIIINDSVVTLSNVNTSGNGWYSVNVDVIGRYWEIPDAFVLTVDAACTFNDALQIVADNKEDADALAGKLSLPSGYYTLEDATSGAVVWTDDIPENKIRDTLTIGGKAYSVTYAAEGDIVINNDTKPDWNWEACGSKSVTGDFAVVYEWVKSDDAANTDVVIEIVDGTQYYDVQVGMGGATGWGNPPLAATTAYTSALTKNGAAWTEENFPGTTNGSSEIPAGNTFSFLGSYKAIVARVGGQIVIEVTFTQANTGDVYVYTYTASYSTIAALTTQLNGNTWYIKDITVTVGAIAVGA